MGTRAREQKGSFIIFTYFLLELLSNKTQNLKYIISYLEIVIERYIILVLSAFDPRSKIIVVVMLIFF